MDWIQLPVCTQDTTEGCLRAHTLCIFKYLYDIICMHISDSYLASYPGREGEGKKRPGAYCMRMHEVPQQNLGLRIRLYIFRISYRYMSVNYSVSFR